MPAELWVPPGSTEPLEVWHPNLDAGDRAVILGCEMCQWTGRDLDAWRDGRSVPCPFCARTGQVLHRYLDEDGDAWLDAVTRALARWSGGLRPLVLATLLVVHRYSRGRGEAGPRYVEHPTGRHVSWHATAHCDDFGRAVTQHLPASQIGWHAGRRDVNRVSIGIEGDAAKSGNVHDPWDDAQITSLCELALSYRAICPNLKYITGHHDIVPLHRQDPGRAFPWDHVCETTGLERLTHKTIGVALRNILP